MSQSKRSRSKGRPRFGNRGGRGQEHGRRRLSLESLEPRLLLSIAPSVLAGDDAWLSEGELFQGSGSFSDTDSTNWSATVDYGDGAGVQELALNSDKTFNLAHVYGEQGVHTVTVSITDDEATTGTDDLLVTVVNVAPSLSVIGSQSLSGPGQWSATDVGAFTDPGFGSESFSYTIDWGDGSTPDTGAATVDVEGGGRAAHARFLRWKLFLCRGYMHRECDGDG